MKEITCTDNNLLFAKSFFAGDIYYYYYYLY